MSAELTRARQQLAQVRACLRQGKPIPAAQAVQAALHIMLKGQLLKAERQEFDRLLDEAVTYLANDEAIRKIYPLQLIHVPGQERELAESVQELLEALNALVAEGAQEHFRAREERRRALIEQGRQELESGAPEEALRIFAVLEREFPDDPQQRGEIGAMLLEAGQYEAAVEYLAGALSLDAELFPFYPMIGIALRKLERFDEAERYYLRALERMRTDPTLYFNMGRLYVDWAKWEKAAKVARAALHLRPDFVEAQKLLAYAEKKLEEEAG